jgi:DNA polymerase-1
MLALEGVPLLILDGNNLLYRSMFVPSVREMEIGPAFSVLQTTRYLIEGLADPQIQVVMVYDGGLSERRKELFPEYKAGRKDKSHMDFSPELFSMQRALLNKCLEKLGVNVIKYPGVEADDIVARIVFDSQYSMSTKYIFSTDQDFYQLLDCDYGETWQVRPVRKNQVKHPPPLHFRVHEGQEPRDLDFVNHEVVEEEYDFSPKMWPLYKALSGDGSDGIPGIPGVGGTTAKVFCSLYEKNGGVVPKPEEIPGRFRKAIARALENYEVVQRNKKLIDLWIGQHDAPRPVLETLEKDHEWVRQILAVKFGVSVIKEHWVYWSQPWRRVC